MNVILLGPPGCGKGTQADRICEDYSLIHLAPGDLLRNEAKKHSALGEKIRELIDNGQMVDDETVAELVHQKVGTFKTGYLLDGFPRTVEQALLLEDFMHIHAVIDIQVGDQEVINRISQRWMVEISGEQHSFIGRDAAEAFAKEHNGHVFQRHDDKPETVSTRLKNYHTLTEPLIHYFGERQKLFIVNGEKPIENVYVDIKKVLDSIRR